MAPFVLPLITLGAQFLGQQAQKNAARQQLPAEILAASAARNGAPTLELQARQKLRGIDDMNLIQYAPAAMQLASAMAGKQGPTAAERDELEEIQRQKAEGFRTRPMRAYEF